MVEVKFEINNRKMLRREHKRIMTGKVGVSFIISNAHNFHENNQSSCTTKQQNPTVTFQC